MNIRKQNTFIEISEMGLKLEIKSDMLLNSLISDTTKNVLEQMLKDKLSQLKTHFEEIDTKIESESKEHNSTYFNELKENPNINVSPRAMAVIITNTKYSSLSLNRRNFTMLNICRLLLTKYYYS